MMIFPGIGVSRCHRGICCRDNRVWVTPGPAGTGQRGRGGGAQDGSPNESGSELFIPSKVTCG